MSQCMLRVLCACACPWHGCACMSHRTGHSPRLLALEEVRVLGLELVLPAGVLAQKHVGQAAAAATTAQAPTQPALAACDRWTIGHAQLCDPLASPQRARAKIRCIWNFGCFLPCAVQSKNATASASRHVQMTSERSHRQATLNSSSSPGSMSKYTWSPSSTTTSGLSRIIE